MKARKNIKTTQLAEQGRKPSLLSPDIDVEEFVRNFHGKGLYAPGGDGSPREIVDAGKVVGKYWNNKIFNIPRQ